MRELIRNVKFDFLHLHTAFPEMMIVRFDMVGRTAWRWPWSVKKVDKARVKVNKVGRFVTRNGGLVVRHRELEVDTWRYMRIYISWRKRKKA